MKKLILLTVSFLAGLSLQAQFPGYLGKKNLIEGGMNIQVPAIYDYFYIRANDDDFYKEESGRLESKLDWINPGARLSYLRLLGEHLGLGMDFSLDAINTRMYYYDDDPYNYNNGPDTWSYHCENLKYRSLTFNPKIEISGRDGLLPVGISHQFGFGFRVIKLVEKEYLNEYLEEVGWNYTQKQEQKDYSGYFTSARPNRFIYKSINYTLNYRKPMSDHLLLNFGFRYSLNLGKSLPEYGAYDGYGSFQEHVYSLLNKQQLSSILQFNIGVTYAL